MLMHVSVLYIVSISRHVYVCVYVCNIHTYMHTCMFYFLLIMLCKFVNKMYIKSHDMRKTVVSERGGGADKKKKKITDRLWITSSRFHKKLSCSLNIDIAIVHLVSRHFGPSPFLLLVMLCLVDPTDYRHDMVYGMAWRAWHGIWYGLPGMAWYMVWPGGHGRIYVTAWQAWHGIWWAWHGIWYGLGGHGVEYGT